MAKASKKPGNKQAARDPEYIKRAGETSLQYHSRIATHEQSARDRTRPIISPFAEQHGKYVDVFVHHDETGSKTQTKRVSNTLEKWIDEGGIGFESGAVAFIRKCQAHWETIGNPKVTANYGERIHGDQGNGMAAHEARSELNYYQKELNAPPYWRIFENVVRHNQPAGIAGSDLATNPASRIASAKVVVGTVASVMASKIS